MNLIPWRHKRENRNGGTISEHPLARLRDEMDDIFDRFWRDPWSTNLVDMAMPRSGFSLRTNLAETDDELTITAELPGVDPKDVDISVSGNTLQIRGEKKEEKQDRKKAYHYVERSYGSFQRSIALPSSVDPDKVDASYRNGILTVTLQKRPDAKPKRIAVKSA